MADTYFDDNEVSEYGEYFYEEAKKLEGRSKIFNIAELRAQGRIVLDAFHKERTDAAGSLGGVRKDAATATTEARDVLSRFYSFLGSLKAGSADKEGFFKNGKMGNLERSKPADIQTKLEAVILGFSAKGNGSFKDRDDWNKELTEAHSALKSSLDTKESKRTDATRSTSKKNDAYDAFVSFYTDVAKPAISGTLGELKRKSEYHLFFKDLQVKETPKDKKKQAEAGKKAAETKKKAGNREQGEGGPAQGNG
jgi:hypothetical protein